MPGNFIPNMAKGLSKKFFQSGLATIGRYLKPHKDEVVALVVLSLISALGNAVTPYLGGKLLDAILGKVSRAAIFGYSISPFVLILGAWVLARLLTDVAERFKSVRQEKLAANLEADYIINGFSKLLRFPMSFHKKQKIGEITERVRRASSWLEAITNRIIVNLAPEFFSIFIAIIITFTIKPILAAFLTGAVVIYALILIRVAPRLSDISRKMQRAYSRAYGEAHDTVLNVQAVKHATAEEYEHKKLFRNFRMRAARLWTDYISIGSNLNFTQRIIITLTQFTLFVFSVYLIRNGALTVGELVAFNGYAAMLFGPFVALGRNWDVVQNGLVAIERSEEILRYPEEDYDPPGSKKLREIKGEIEFQNVSFKYSRSQTEIVKNISFKVKPGQSVALVGESGVGKTTLLEFVSFYHRPTSGKVFVDGRDLSKLNLSHLRSFIAIVPQEIILFNDTIKNNIRYGRFDATDEEVVAAARLAHADEFISVFPQKYNQMVGERGVKLSTGQKQRVAIARAILRNPRILILDEPTSALDAKSEKFISESLERLMRGRTTFIIAHRLSTVRKADMILVLEKGMVVEQGRHEELLKIPNGKYRRLYELQIGLK